MGRYGWEYASCAEEEVCAVCTKEGGVHELDNYTVLSFLDKKDAQRGEQTRGYNGAFRGSAVATVFGEGFPGVVNVCY